MRRQLALATTIVCVWAALGWAEPALRVIPPPGATFAPGQRFDIRIEADDLRGQPRQFTISVNGRDQKRDIFGNAQFTTFPAPVTGRGAAPSNILNGGVIRRNWSLDRPGKYEIKATLVDADGAELAATTLIEVQQLQPSSDRARNVILFVGDGMGPAIRTAARIVSKGIEGGRIRGLLEMDQMETLGMVMTASLDALVTDSSPGAGAWSTGNKSVNNWHGVFPDNTGPSTAGAALLDRNREAAQPFFDNPRVENLAEYLQRTRRMSTGVVSTVAVTDSTPGAFSSHTIRYAQTYIAEQMLAASGHSVILGGGARYFLPPGDPLLGNIPSSRTDMRNLVDEFKKAGFMFVSTASELEHAGRADKLLGLFHGAEMSSRYDRARAKEGHASGIEAVGRFPDQPTLELMTRQALNVLGKNSNGFLLVVEAGSVDRELHRMDPHRAVDEVIELDKAIGVARAWAAERRDDTLILVTADHETSGLVLTGVERAGRPVGRSFPNYEDKNYDGFPDHFHPEFSLRFDFASGFNPAAEPRDYDLPRNLRELNPSTTLRPAGGGGAAGHSAVDVPISARGPGARMFGGVQDNTEIFFKILRALGER
jgi:alkaline phosphatase